MFLSNSFKLILKYAFDDGFKLERDNRNLTPLRHAVK